MKSKVNGATHYRPDIDGLRAIAVMSVILFHAGFKIFQGGYVGVDVFYVISGYLITTIILGELKTNSFSFINFYERRARRIIPALSVMMLVCIPVAWLLFLPNNIRNFYKSIIATSIFVSNILFWRESGYFASGTELKPLLHTWSLALEEQYYFIFPFILFFIFKKNKKLITYVLIASLILSLILCQWGSSHIPGSTFYLLPTRGWEFILGSLASLVVERKKERYDKTISELGSFVGITLILAGILLFDSAIPYPSYLTILPTVGTALLLIYCN